MANGKGHLQCLQLFVENFLPSEKTRPPKILCMFLFEINRYTRTNLEYRHYVSFIVCCMLCMEVFSKTLKGRTVIGVAAGRFHTVLWTREAVYTMGLNGGQLGKLH